MSAPTYVIVAPFLTDEVWGLEVRAETHVEVLSSWMRAGVMQRDRTCEASSGQSTLKVYVRAALSAGCTLDVCMQRSGAQKKRGCPR